MRYTARLATTLSAALLVLPTFAFAFPFGGQTSTVVKCYNQAIFARVGPPRGGDYIWTPSTRTYQFGPPSHSGQWLLGLASAPYYCVVSIMPVIVWSGTAIDMMGSSGGGGYGALLSGAVPTTAAPPPLSSQAGGSSSGAGGSGVGGTTSVGHVIINEVYANVDASHGNSASYQWIELYNASAYDVDLTGWLLQSSVSTLTLPVGSILQTGAYMVLVANGNTAQFWTIPTSARIMTVSAPIGALKPAGDALSLVQNGNKIDAVSWGTNSSVFSAPPGAIKQGYSLTRSSVAQDTNTATDWISSSNPTPGK